MQAQYCAACIQYFQVYFVTTILFSIMIQQNFAAKVSHFSQTLYWQRWTKVFVAYHDELKVNMFVISLINFIIKTLLWPTRYPGIYGEDVMFFWKLFANNLLDLHDLSNFLYNFAKSFFIFIKNQKNWVWAKVPFWGNEVPGYSIYKRNRVHL